MSYRHTLEAALESLHEIEELLGDFSHNEKIPAMDMDLALQKMRSLYDLMLMIRKQQEVLPEETSPASPVASSTLVAPEAPDDLVPENKPMATPVMPPVAQPKAAPVEEKIIPPVVEPAATPKEKAPAAAPAESVRPAAHKEKPLKPGSQTLSDQFKGKTTLHETLNHPFSREEETLALARPVSDLLEAIGINDRFTFVRELFNGDTAAFENTVNILNDSANFNEAYNYMIQHFDWDMDSQTVQILLNIIRRKFIKGRHE
jgi:hypothetical protein